MTTALQALTAPGGTRRTLLRRFLEVRGLVGGFQRPHHDTAIVTGDGVRLDASWLPGPDDDAPAVAVIHGFGAHRRKPAYAYLADVLSTRCHVLTVDLRGHQRSGGTCTLGDREHLDVAAAVGWLRDRGHGWVAPIGVSMGGTATLHALAAGLRVEAAVAISTPGWLRSPPQTDAMRTLHALWRSPAKRAAMRWTTRIRIVAPAGWTAPPHPVEAAAAVEVPLLVVHGEDDHFFPADDARAISAAGSGRLWLEPAGFGHAEDGIGPAFAAALTDAVVAARHVGAFPARDEVGA